MLRGIGLFASIVAVTLAACSDDPSTLNGSHRSGTSSGAGTSGSSGDGTSSGDTGTSGDTGSSGTTQDGSTPAEICVATINDYRKTKGLPAYARWDAAETCSDGQAKSDGSTSAAHGAFGKCGEHAQNECPGWPGPPDTMIPQCLKAMFGEGEGGGHYEAIMGKQYTKVACGFGTAPNGQIWSVQNFQ
jgi:Cysteine-rich secretory protein family